jgi:hypothetical protein
MIEGEFHFMKNESNQRHLMEERDWLSWVQSAQEQGGEENRLPVIWAHPDSSEPVTGRKCGINVGEDGR